MNEHHAAACLAALGNPTRIRVFRLLVQAGPEGLTVGDLQRLSAVPASTLAHHIAALVKTGLVEQRRRGREVISTADYDRVHRLVAYLTENCCGGIDHRHILPTAGAA